MILRSKTVLALLKGKTPQVIRPPRPRRVPGVTLLRETLARLYLAAEAMSLEVKDIDLNAFDPEDRERWFQAADDHLRRWVNEEP